MTPKGRKGKMIAEKNLQYLQKLLLRKRSEILYQVKGLGGRWQENSEPQIEAEEMAQEAALNEPYVPLDFLERNEIGDINQALSKMEDGAYGICETCGKPITLKRLKSIPWTRYCRKDAQGQERLIMK
jgi:DnaK suppressor protein